MRRSNFALRLLPSLLEELRKAAASEGVALNQLINVAVAEKVSALRTREYFEERSRGADREKALKVLKKAGGDHPPVKGDELPVARESARRLAGLGGTQPRLKPGKRRRSAK